MSKGVAQRFAIGTTKLGMPYGAIQPHQVGAHEVENIFDKATNLGFDCFDTAPSYGDAESLIGNYLSNSLRQSCITKVAKITDEIIDEKSLQLVEEQFQQSLHAMQTNTCYGLLVHDVKDLFKQGAELLVDWMKSVQEKGRVKKIGVSVYTPYEAQNLFDKFEFDLVQLPCNIFDQRFITSGVLQELANKNVEIHARSLFLKGLILKDQTDESDLPHLLLDHNRAFHKAMLVESLTPYDVCMSFAKYCKLVNRWVVGVSSSKQLDQLLSANDELDISFADWAFKDELMLDPRSW